MKANNAIRIMIGLLVAVLLFHLSIILKIVSYEIAWGGRLKNDIEMYVFEMISIGINLFLVFILLIKGQYIKAFVSPKVVDLILWLFAILFGLNTLGNILAETIFEKFFALLTFASVVLIVIILRKSQKELH